jgi:4-hydroxybutyryl-CoA dehydratase/vinylacetyl-CoA-Delta-isomerase
VDGGSLDAGNAGFAGQEAIIVFDRVFIPHAHVFMDSEWQMASFARRTVHYISPVVVRL